MAYEIPADIQKRRTQIEQIYEMVPTLEVKREKLAKSLKDEEADASEIAELVGEHTALLNISQKIYKNVLTNFIQPMKKALEEARDKAKRKGEEAKLEKSESFQQRQEALDDLGTEVGWVQNIVTDLKFFIQDLQHKQTTLENQQANQETASRLKSEVSEEGDQIFGDEPTNEPEEYLTEDEDEDVAEPEPIAPPQKAARAALRQQTKKAQTPAKRLARQSQHKPLQHEHEDLVPKNMSIVLQNRVQELEATIRRFKAHEEDLEDEKNRYKRKYQKQKEDTEEAEEALRRYKEYNRGGSTSGGRDTQQLLDKMDAGHQKLLNAMEQGFNRVTIDMLRTLRPS